MDGQDIFQKDIEILTSILNSNTVNKELIALIENAIMQRVNLYINPVLVVPWDKVVIK